MQKRINLHKYTCNICFKQFYDHPFFLGHLYTHSNIKRFACSACPATYKTNGQLNRRKTRCRNLQK